MKKYLTGFGLILTLTACGGGGGGSGSNASPQSPDPALTLVSGTITRMTSENTTISIDVVVRPNFVLPANVYAIATDGTHSFRSDVVVNANADGSATLVLNSASFQPAGHYLGTASIQVCADAACASPLTRKPVAVDFDLNVLRFDTPWPTAQLTPLSPVTGASDWGMLQSNAGHTGYVPVTLDPGKFVPRWKVSNPEIYAVGDVASSRLVASNGRYFVASQGKIYAFNESDGSSSWQYAVAGLTPNNGAIVNPLAVSNGTVYAVIGRQGEAKLLGLKDSDGTLLFQTAMQVQNTIPYGPTIGTSGVYTSAGPGSELYAFDGAGKSLYTSSEFAVTDAWTALFSATDAWAPAVDAFGAYVYARSGLTVIDPTLGTKLKSIPDPSFTNFTYPDEIGASPILGAPGSVFAVNRRSAEGAIGGSYISTLSHFNLNANRIDWSVTGSYRKNPAYGEGVLYITNQSPFRLEARSESDGTLLWSWIPNSTFDRDFESDVLLTKNLIFVSTNVATYALDRTTHSAVWSFPFAGELALSANGVLYIYGSGQVLTINTH